MSFCTFCGMKLEDTFNCCPKCGNSVMGIGGQQSYQMNQQYTGQVYTNQIYMNQQDANPTTWSQTNFQNVPYTAGDGLRESNKSEKKIWIIAGVSTFAAILIVVLLIVFLPSKDGKGKLAYGASDDSFYEENAGGRSKSAGVTLEDYYNDNPEYFIECFGSEDMEDVMSVGGDYELLVEGNDVYFVMYLPEEFNQMQDMMYDIFGSGLALATGNTGYGFDSDLMLDLSPILGDQDFRDAMNTDSISQMGSAGDEFQAMTDEIAKYIENQYGITPYLYFAVCDGRDNVMGEWEYTGN